MLLHVAAGCRSACVLAVAAVALAAGACDRSVGTPAPVAGAVNALPYVGAAAAGALDADGRFLLAAPPKLSRPQISEDQAKALAVAFIRKFGQFSRASFEQVHGAPIDFATLRAADRVYYAAAPYEQTVPETFHPARIKRTGPYYLVPLIAADRPVLSVAVSAYNTNINIGPDGLVRFPAMAGNDFDPLPAPLDREFSMPVSPERAAQIVFEATGRRVVAPPQLLLPDLRYAAHFARWKLRLDGPAIVHGVKTRTAYRASELYVGRYAELSVALPVQPAGIAVVDPAIGATITAARVADAPVHFETVNPASRQ